MCTAFLAWKVRPDLPLVVASNRDEFHQRPTAAAAWQGQGQWFGGRDEKDGGSWLGVAKKGRFALLTNVRDPAAENPQAISRGGLVKAWLEGQQKAAFCQQLEQSYGRYNGFNLLFGDDEVLFYFGSASGTEPSVQTLGPGIYGLSNASLDVEWPKVLLGKRRFQSLLSAESLDFDVLRGLMADRRQAPDQSLPDTFVPQDWERLLSSLFIVTPAYGTRATTVFSLDQSGRYNFSESRFLPSGELDGFTQESFAISHEE